MSSYLPDQRLLSERLTLPFVGLTTTDTDDVDVPRRLERQLNIGDDPESLTDVIELLPDASVGDLRSANEFVNEDGTLDVDALEDVDGIDVQAAADALDTTPSDVTDATRYQPVRGSNEIIDQRREALAALGYQTRYQWQIASTDYAIINPPDAYRPALEAFQDFNEATDIVGWLSWRDYGGTVDLYILFTDETIDTPAAMPYPIYLGYHTGYGFTNNRKLFLNHFGLYPEGDDHGTYLYNIGESHSRKHVGDPTNAAHETANDRVPIDQWWIDGHKAFLRDDSLVTDVANAESITIRFNCYPFDLQAFYELLEIPTTTAEAATGRVAAYDDPTAPSMWTAGMALALTLADCFTGDKAGPRFRAQSRTATRLIKHPDSAISAALREYEEAGHPHDDTDDPTDDSPAGNDLPIDIMLSEIDSPEDLAQLDGVNVADLTTEQKSQLAASTEQVLINDL